jgi:triacylglycerol lipase
LAFDKNFAITAMYPAANAAYVIMGVPQPPLLLPVGYSLVGAIHADPTKAFAAMLQAHPDHQRMATATLAESSIFGFVAWNAAAQNAIVSIRGTQTIWDWLDDFDAAPTPFLPDPGAGLAHMGFQLVYLQIRDSIRQLITSGCPGVRDIWVTGHSLGAAVAVLCALDVVRNYGLGIIPQLYTFAGPRPGDAVFQNTFNAAIGNCQRIVNFMDVVPQVPLPPLYEHVGKETLVNGGFKPLDVTYAHHLTTYLNGIQKMT